MDPFMGQEQKDMETEGERAREDQEETEGVEEEEKMEEDETSEKKRIEENEEDEEMGGGEEEEEADASILDPEEGEEEGGEELDLHGEEQLLKEEEVGQDRMEGTDSEDVLRNFINSDSNNSEQINQRFPEQNINSPKDYMSDDNYQSHQQNSQQNAFDPYDSNNFNKSYYYSTKPDGCTIYDQGESQLMSSTSNPPDTILEAREPDEEKQEEEEQEVEEVEEKEQEMEDNADTDVLYAGEVMVDEKEKEVTIEEKKEEASTEVRGGAEPGGPLMAGRDCRAKYKEVRTHPM